jgi:uncharacterized iron-regulated protein
MNRLIYRFWLSLLAICAGMAHFGCATSRAPVSAAPHGEGFGGPFRQRAIIHLETGESVSFNRMVDRLGSADVVFVGEVHDNPEHHLIQVQLLQALLARHGPLRVAMEFFEAPQQQALDRYMDGLTTEEVFLEEVRWNETWRFPYHYYRPLLLLVKAFGKGVVAINAPRGIVQKVARYGLSSLTAEERGRIATTIDLHQEPHRAYVKEIFKHHSHESLKNFDFFYQAQCVWEETMAENIVRRLQTHPEKMVVFSGNGHIISKFGIPDRVQKRLDVSLTTVLLQPWAEGKKLEKAAADWVWFTGSCSAMRSAHRTAGGPEDPR